MHRVLRSSIILIALASLALPAIAGMVLVKKTANICAAGKSNSGCWNAAEKGSPVEATFDFPKAIDSDVLVSFMVVVSGSDLDWKLSIGGYIVGGYNNQDSRTTHVEQHIIPGKHLDQGENTLKLEVTGGSGKVQITDVALFYQSSGSD